MKFKIALFVAPLFFLLHSFLYADVNAICQVRVEGTKEHSEALGTGFWIEDNTIITANHVIMGAVVEDLQVRVEHKGRYYKAEIVKFDVDSDVAILKVAGADHLTNMKLAKGSPKEGDKIKNWGHAYGKWGVYSTKGTYKRTMNMIPNLLEMKGSTNEFYLLDGAVIGGMSGGPATNEAGEVVGLVSAVRYDKETKKYESFLVSAKEIQELLDSPEEKKVLDIGDIIKLFGEHERDK